jgi:hypothetical protein
MEFIKWFSKPKEIQHIGFEDMKYAIKTNQIIINTLSVFEQDCLIYGTVAYDKEEQMINNLIDNNSKECIIIIYGKHCADDSLQKKYNQLTKYGFQQVYMYMGGLFEWLLLQDIYSCQEFPTTSVCKDILKYRAPSILQSYKVLRLMR